MATIKSTTTITKGADEHNLSLDGLVDEYIDLSGIDALKKVTPSSDDSQLQTSSDVETAEATNVELPVAEYDTFVSATPPENIATKFSDDIDIEAED